MDAIIVFQDDNSHPLAGLLRRGFRHVWCATLDPDRGWTSYDWRQGVPELRIEAGPEFDLAAHYRSEGHTVLQIEAGNIPSYKPFILNNCVGHVKLVLGVKSWAATPHQLHSHFTKEPRSMRSRLKLLLTLPGFGDGPNQVPLWVKSGMTKDGNLERHGLKVLRDQKAAKKKAAASAPTKAALTKTSSSTAAASAPRAASASAGPLNRRPSTADKTLLGN